MPKLPILKHQLSVIKPLIGSYPNDKKEWLKLRDKTITWRKWYYSRRWRKLRWQILKEAHFTCAICQSIEHDTSKLVCDHIKPHKGNEKLFYDLSNLQCLCKHCHDSIKQREEKRWLKGTIFYPEYLQPSLIPLTIMCGAPASGKSKYIAMNKGAKDIVIDLDEIVASISGVPSHDWSRKKYAEKAFSKRNQMLSSLSMDKVHRNYDHAWFIVSEPEAFRRSWWEMKLNPEMIIVLETSEQQCLKNADLDSDRNRQETALAINKWWNNYTPRNGDVIFRQT